MIHLYIFIFNIYFSRLWHIYIFFIHHIHLAYLWSIYSLFTIIPLAYLSNILFHFRYFFCLRLSLWPNEFYILNSIIMVNLIKLSLLGFISISCIKFHHCSKFSFFIYTIHHCCGPFTCIRLHSSHEIKFLFKSFFLAP